jgi:hypothetical protein
MEVTHGKKHLTSHQKGDWKVGIVFSKGFTSVHTRRTAPDIEPSEDVRVAMEAATKAAASKELQAP